MKTFVFILLCSLSMFSQISERVWDKFPGTTERFQEGWAEGTRSLTYSNTSASDSLLSKTITLSKENNGNITTFLRVDNTTGTLKQVYKLKILEPITNSVKSVDITWYHWGPDTSIGDTVTAAYDNLPLYYSTNNVTSNWAGAMYSKIKMVVYWFGSQAGTIRQGVNIR